MNIFWETHSNLPREGPGDSVSTARAYAAITNLPPQPKILDIGCGPGMQTLELARLSQGKIIAIDFHQPFLDELVRRAKEARLEKHIQARKLSMFEMDFAPEQFDLIWSEGAIYIMGFEQGFKACHPFLKPGGYMAVTEASWFQPNPSQEVFDFWKAAYPEMGTIDENIQRLERQGFKLVEHFHLPDSSWWENYYNPLAERIAMLRKKYAGNAEAQKQLDEEFAEIELFRKYSKYYGYEFYIAQKL
ncbi:MAG: methyltransferase domain-containing protein [Anaerolineales bacterium]|nr:methyltransferase domain-containing protein [Anaerolineales bacterium]